MGGRTAISIPTIPSPASLQYHPQHPYNTIPSPQSQKHLVFVDNHKKEPPNSMLQKVAETTPAVALTRVLLVQGALALALEQWRGQKQEGEGVGGREGGSSHVGTSRCVRVCPWTEVSQGADTAKPDVR